MLKKKIVRHRSVNQEQTKTGAGRGRGEGEEKDENSLEFRDFLCDHIFSFTRKQNFGVLAKQANHHQMRIVGFSRRRSNQSLRLWKHYIIHQTGAIEFVGQAAIQLINLDIVFVERERTKD